MADAALEQRHHVGLALDPNDLLGLITQSVDVEQRWQSVGFLELGGLLRVRSILPVHHFATPNVRENDGVAITEWLKAPVHGVTAERIDCAGANVAFSEELPEPDGALWALIVGVSNRRTRRTRFSPSQSDDLARPSLSGWA
jgi:hypothetical protein